MLALVSRSWRLCHKIAKKMLSTERSTQQQQQPGIGVGLICKACLIRCWTEAENIMHYIKFWRGVTFHQFRVAKSWLKGVDSLTYVRKKLTLACYPPEHLSTRPGSVGGWGQLPPTRVVERGWSCACDGSRCRRRPQSRRTSGPCSMVPWSASSTFSYVHDREVSYSLQKWHRLSPGLEQNLQDCAKSRSGELREWK